MSDLGFLFDVSPTAGGIGAVLGIAFFFILAVVAFIAFKMLKRTVKMAVRMTIVVGILVVALIGSIALLYFGTGGKSSSKPPASTPARTR